MLVSSLTKNQIRYHTIGEGFAKLGIEQKNGFA